MNGFCTIGLSKQTHFHTQPHNTKPKIAQNLNHGPRFLFDYLKENFQTSALEKTDNDWQISIEPIDYEQIKMDPQFRLLIEHTASYKGLTIILYERTMGKIEAVQERIQAEIINQ